MNKLCDSKQSVLLVIDYQGKIFEMAFNSEQLRVMGAKVMRLADLFEVPVILTEQYPQGLGSTIPAIKEVFDGLSTERHLLSKTAFGCCGDGPFCELLDRFGDRRDVVVVGIESHVCVQQTVLALLQQGRHRVVVLEDCIGGRIKAYHEQAIARFRQCGAVISNLESLAFEWARDKQDPRFKAMSALIRE